MFERLLKWVNIRWEEILLTQDIDCYIKVRAKLLEKGIIHKTKIYNRNMPNGSVMTLKRPLIYSISVKKDEIQKVSEIAFQYKGFIK